MSILDKLRSTQAHRAIAPPSAIAVAQPVAPSPRSLLTPAQRLALAGFKTLATNNVNAIEAARRAGKCQTWAEIEAIIKSPVPPQFRARSEMLVSPLAYMNFRAWYRDGAETRFIEAIKNTALAATTPPPVVHVTVDAGEFKLRPQQRKSVDLGVSVFSDPDGPRAIVLPLGTGRGKTIIIGALCKALKSAGIVKPPPVAFLPPILYLTRNRPVRQTKRKLARMGLTEKDVLVLSYSALRTKRYTMFFESRTEMRQNQATKVEVWTGPAFGLIVMDECQDIKKTDTRRTQLVEALLRAQGAEDTTRCIFASATPFVTLMDTRMFVLAARIKWAGETVNNDNFKAFVGQFVYKVGGTISEPNSAALDRFKDFMGAAIVAPPNDPVKTKAYNGIELIDFDNDDDRRMYANAERTYVEACDNTGRNVNTSDRAARLRAFSIFTQAEEMCKTTFFARRAFEIVTKENLSAVIAERYTNSLIDTVGKLARLGVKRDEISIIWGGRKIIKESECYSNDEFREITMRCNREAAMRRDGVGEHLPADKLHFLDRKERAKYRKTVVYINEFLMRQETRIEARDRVEWLDKMMLNKQTEEQQDVEVERFLDGKTRYCIYTLAAGGVGIDLDHQRETAFPRRGLFTPSYWAEEVVQSAGRNWRPASSLSDTHNKFVFIKGTIVANHLAPILAKKISSINTMCQSGIDFEELLAEKISLGAVVAPPRAEDLTAVGSQEELDESLVADDDDAEGEGED